MRERKLEFYKNKRRVDFTNESAEKIGVPIENAIATLVSDRKY